MADHEITGPHIQKDLMLITLITVCHSNPCPETVCFLVKYST